MEPWRSILKLIERDGAAGLVTVARVDGSTPREAGARMVVARDGSISGSIGGGPLEWAAIDVAKALVAAGPGAEWKTVSLGPALDQCCGGRAELLHESFAASDHEWIAPLAASAMRIRPARSTRKRRGSPSGALTKTGALAPWTAGSAEIVRSGQRAPSASAASAARARPGRARRGGIEAPPCGACIERSKDCARAVAAAQSVSRAGAPLVCRIGCARRAQGARDHYPPARWIGRGARRGRTSRLRSCASAAAAA